MVKHLFINVGDLGSIPRLVRFPGEGNGNPLQYSCLENPMDWGAWCRLLSMGSQRVGHNWVISLYYVTSHNKKNHLQLTYVSIYKYSDDIVSTTVFHWSCYFSVTGCHSSDLSQSWPPLFIFNALVFIQTCITFHLRPPQLLINLLTSRLSPF